jgi:hypothetical protein
MWIWCLRIIYCYGYLRVYIASNKLVLLCVPGCAGVGEGLEC